MIHLMAYEAASERLFKEVHGASMAIRLVGRRELPWDANFDRITGLHAGHLVVFTAKGLVGTDPVSVPQALRFVDLALGSMGAESLGGAVTLHLVFTLPDAPEDMLYWSSEWKPMPGAPPPPDRRRRVGIHLDPYSSVDWGGYGGNSRKNYLFAGSQDAAQRSETEATVGWLEDNRAAIHMASVDRQYPHRELVRAFFMDDDWVHIAYRVIPPAVAPKKDDVIPPARTFMCDGLPGVEQCLDSLRLGR